MAAVFRNNAVLTTQFFRSSPRYTAVHAPIFIIVTVTGWINGLSVDPDVGPG